MLTEFNSITKLEKALPDEQSCVAYFRDLRWPEGVACVHGCYQSKIYNLANGGFKCGVVHGPVSCGVAAFLAAVAAQHNVGHG